MSTFPFWIPSSMREYASNVLGGNPMTRMVTGTILSVDPIFADIPLSLELISDPNIDVAACTGDQAQGLTRCFLSGPSPPLRPPALASIAHIYAKSRS